ncbi:SRPBCC family protein [Archangium gephyra]|uniref:SRPBCC family protein n=1 Tax=Archangium gephyra TaxID=48 RepID=UPI0035D49B4F
MNEEYGTFTAPDTVRLERVLPGPIERVWSYLTEPGKRGTWLAAGDMELRAGGRVELNFRHSQLSSEQESTPERYKQYQSGHTVLGRITRCEPPRLLAYTWDEASGKATDVTFELSQRGQDVRLVLTHRGYDSREDRVSVASGWHTHLAILIDHLNGRVAPNFWTSYERNKDEYEKRFPAG